MVVQLRHFTRHPGREFSLQYFEPDGDCYLHILDDLERTILRRMLAVFGKYYWIWGIVGPQRDWSEQQWVEWDVIQHVVEDLEGKLVSGCNSADLVAAIEGISASINATISSGGCSDVGSGGSGLEALPATGFTDTGSNYPDAFESRNEYDSFKCGAAYLVWQTIRQDLIFLQQLDTSGITAAILAASLITPIPFDDLAALALLITQLVLEAAFDTALENIITEWEDDEENIVCWMYQSANESGFLGSLGDWIDAKLSYVEGSLLGFLVSSDAAQWLFSKPAKLIPEYDCSLCGVEPFFVYGFGSGDDIYLDGGVVSVTSEYYAANGYYYIQLTQDTCVNKKIVISNCTKSTGWVAGAVKNCAGGNLWDYHSQTNPNGTYNPAAELISFGHTQAFSFDISVETP